MTAAFARNKVYYGRVPHPDGGSVVRRLSKDPRIAKGMERAIAGLKDAGEFGILRAIIEKRPGFRIAEVFACWPNGLKDLRAKLSDRDVEPLVKQWHATIEAQYPTGDTARQYLRQVRELIPEGKPFPVSRLTVEVIEPWLYGLPHKSGTKLRYHAAVSSFSDYLKRTKVIAANPMRDVPSPKPSEPRVRYIGVEECIRLAQAQAEPYRTLCILSHQGIEFGAAVRIRRKDVNEAQHTIHVRGSKNEWRNRVCYIAPWAWPFIESRLGSLLPTGLLAPALHTATNRSHHDACKALGIEDYRFHDGRHSYAVRLAQAGTPLEVIAKQLGHRDLKQAARCYARFRPTTEDMARWESIAAAKDIEESRRASR